MIHILWRFFFFCKSIAKHDLSFKEKMFIKPDLSTKMEAARIFIFDVTKVQIIALFIFLTMEQSQNTSWFFFFILCF